MEVMGISDSLQMTMSDFKNSKLSLELFQDIFQKLDPLVQIHTVEEEQGSGRGDNYTAILYRIHLSGHRKHENDGREQKWEEHLLCKRLPENIQLREAYKSDQLFRNEVQFYTIIMPELLKFQASKTSETFQAIPVIYYARGDLLIMEDLKVRNFQMPDRKQGLSLQETRMVLKEVAHFHALSLAYKFVKPKLFDRLRTLTVEGLFCSDNESWYKNYYQKLTKNAIKMVSDVLPEDSKYIKALKDFAQSETFFARMIAIVSEDTPLTALCHGDCWANNFLYRYELNANDDSKQIKEVCLVDFQLIRYSSITLDVANLLFCCTSKSLRDRHLLEFIELYITEHYKWLNILCDKIPDHCNTIEKFEQLFRAELQKFARFALGLSLDIIPISTCSSEDAPDMYNKRNDGMEVKVGAPELDFPPNDLCRQKMSEVLIDLVDNGMV